MTGCADAIQKAIVEAIAERRAMIDRADDLGEVTVSIKIQAGTTWIRGVVWTEERLCRNGNGERRAPSRS